MRRAKKPTQSQRVSAITTTLFVEISLAIIFCQLAFFPIFSNVAGLSFHSFLFLLPFAAAALYLSLPAYLTCAAVLGVILSLRVQAVPFDFYELHVSHPIGALIFSCVCALLIWLALRGFLRLGKRLGHAEEKPWRVALIVVALLVASTVISTAWLQYLNTVYTAYGWGDFVAIMAGRLWSPSFWGQVVFNTLTWSIAAIVVDTLASRVLAGKASMSLRAVFGRRLFVVVVGAFVLTTTISYVFSTMQALHQAESVLSNHANNLLAQLEDRTKRGESVDGLATSYGFGSGGTAVLFADGKVVSTNDERVTETDLREFLDLDESVDTSSVLENTGLQLGQDMETLGITYHMLSTNDGNVAYVDASAADIFANRTQTIALNTLCYLVLFVAVFLLISRDIDHIVIRGFKRTNDVLALITGGDLEQRVDERECEEFVALSEGINTTVDALKSWIAEAERRMERELETGRAIQRGALPQTFPAFPDIDAFDLYASMDAAKEVGGDFYGFFLVDESRLGFLIADVSGKGIPGALFMMTAKTQVERYMNAGIGLAEAIRMANEQLCHGNDAGMFVTLWAATLDWETGELTYVNAGHNFPLLRHGPQGEWEWLKKRCGLFLGTFETAKYREETITLEAGDELILYTDGVNEAFSADEEEYGNDRLERFLAAHNALGPRDLVESLRADVAAWAEGAEQSDDITILCLEYK